MGDRDRFLALSPTFYGKERSLTDMCLEAENLSKNNPDLDRFLSGYKEVKELIQSKQKDQRALLFSDTNRVLSMVFEVLEKGQNMKTLLMTLLPTLDGIIFDSRQIATAIVKIADEHKERNILQILYHILMIPDYDTIVYESASRILAMIYSELDAKKFAKEQENFLVLLISVLGTSEGGKKRKINDHCLVGCLANLLRDERLCAIFVKQGGMSTMLGIMRNSLYDVQVMYYTLLSLWLLSFSEESAKYYSDPASGIIRNMIQVVQAHSREKIWRVAFFTFRNLSTLSEATIEIMVDCGLVKVIDTLKKGNIKDLELKDDLDYMEGLLEKNLKILTSFEKYVKEIQSANLEWSTVHSEKFWKENVKKFEENAFSLIKKLVLLLDSDVPKNQAIACYDLGEFCRFHPFGKSVLEQSDGKKKISDLMQSSDVSTRENAVLALQKIMLHNWQI